MQAKAAHIQAMQPDALLRALASLGATAPADSTPKKLREKLLELLGDSDGEDWDTTLQVAVKRCVTDFLKQFLPEERALRDAARQISSCGGNFENMWQRLVHEACTRTCKCMHTHARTHAHTHAHACLHTVLSTCAGGSRPQRQKAARDWAGVWLPRKPAADSYCRACRL